MVIIHSKLCTIQDIVISPVPEKYVHAFAINSEFDYCKFDDFQTISFKYLLLFNQTIDRGYILEPPSMRRF